MTHVVAGYPTELACKELLFGMQAAGVYAIEIQIPFSDPSADGPIIMHANDVALENNMTVQKCFNMIHTSREKGLTTPVYVMSYANKLLQFGLKKFCQEAKRCHAEGLIVPDLPFDTAEYKELSDYCSQLEIDLVPVLSPGVITERLIQYNLGSHKLVYLTSTRGITGKELSTSKELVQLVKTIRSQSSCLIALGFGIRTAQHVHQSLELVDIAVVGSEVLRKVEQDGVLGVAAFIKQLVNTEAS